MVRIKAKNNRKFEEKINKELFKNNPIK